MDVEQYLIRIGLPAKPPRPTREALGALQRAHLTSVPYENLDIVAERPLVARPLGAVWQNRNAPARRLLLRAERAVRGGCFASWAMASPTTSRGSCATSAKSRCAVTTCWACRCRDRPSGTSATWA